MPRRADLWHSLRHADIPSEPSMPACRDYSPDMDKYVRMGRKARQLMRLTVPVEPHSIDTAFTALGGIAPLHGLSGSQIVGSVCYARKEAPSPWWYRSDDRSTNFWPRSPRSRQASGICGLGRQEAHRFSGAKPVTFIWGVGARMQARLARDGCPKPRDRRNLLSSGRHRALAAAQANPGGLLDENGSRAAAARACARSRPR
jgi:nucleotidyltransferase/DNA polymerase involved in DNA repair